MQLKSLDRLAWLLVSTKELEAELYKRLKQVQTDSNSPYVSENDLIASSVLFFWPTTVRKAIRKLEKQSKIQRAYIQGLLYYRYA